MPIDWPTINISSPSNEVESAIHCAKSLGT
jgi:hypothetical protein